MPGGRPTKYKPEYVEQSAKLCALGATDMELADFFEVDRTKDQYYAYWLYLYRQDRSGVIASRKKKRADTRADRVTPSQRLLNATRARIWAALKGKVSGSLFKRLGYSVSEFMEHLERQFSDGMSWDNYGKWHVDHIKPCASFRQDDDKQFSECWSLVNLQPLWASDNVKKGAKHG